MSNKAFSRNEFFYLQDESSFGTIPNAGGTASVANGDACAMIQFKMNRTTDSIFRKDKTGSRTATAGIGGRKIANFSSSMSLVTSGVAGTAPDCDPMLKSLFGAAPTAKSGTVAITGATNATPIVVTAVAHGLTTGDMVSITGVLGNTAANGLYFIAVLTVDTFQLLGSIGNAAYTSGGTVTKTALVYIPTDAELSFTGWSFRDPSTIMQRAIFGAVCKEGTFGIGEDIATWQSSGDGFWMLDSVNFASATTVEKGGLTAFPTKPTSPVTNGAGIAGFKGLAVLNGNKVTRIRNAQIKYGSGLDLPRDTFNNSYVDTPEADERSTQVTVNMYEDDSAGQAALEQAAIDKTSLDFYFVLGTVPGSVYGMALRGVQLTSPDRDDGQRAFTMAYSNSRAYGSGITAFNEMRLWAI